MQAMPKGSVSPLAAALAGLLAAACKNDPPPPKNVTDQPVLAPPKRPERTGPFRTPSTDPPPPRSEPQLPPEALADVLAKAEAARQAGDTIRASVLLRRCANKVPPSIVCEGRLALVLLPQRAYKAEAEYYLAEAIRGEGEHPVDLDRALAEAAMARGNAGLAAEALGRVAAAPGATAADWTALARALSADRGRLGEAVEAYEKALALDPAPDVRHELAVILAQLGRNDEAIAAFEAFLAATKGQDPARDRRIRARIEELRTGRVRDQVPAGARGRPRPAP